MTEETLTTTEEVVVEEHSTQEVDPSVAEEVSPETLDETPSSVEDTEVTEETNNDIGTEVQYTETGNEVYDTLGSTLVDNGLNPSVFAEELNVQLEKGEDDVSLSEESYAELASKVGDKMASLMEKQYIAEHRKQVSEQKQKVESVFNMFGGEEQFHNIASTLREESMASDEELSELSSMLSAGGIQQKAAYKTIKDLYMSSESFEQNPQFADEGVTIQPSGPETLTRREYVKAKMEAMKSGDLAKVDALNKRARHTMENKAQLWS